MLDRHIWQGFTTMVLTFLVVFGISTFSSVGTTSTQFGITTVHAEKKTRHLPNLLDQQIAILVGLDINPNWVNIAIAAIQFYFGYRTNDDSTTHPAK